MTDWKQITARIRRARTGKDPAGQLSALFSKTRDAMVAFELARYFESVSNNDDAGRWYLLAAERFRRADWKTKAQESATRLGATVAAEIPVLPPKAETPSVIEPTAGNEDSLEVTDNPPTPAPESSGEETISEEQKAAAPVAAPASATPSASARRPRGRGRRGGREHQRTGRSTPPTGKASDPLPITPDSRISDEEQILSVPSSRSLDSLAESVSLSLRGRSPESDQARRVRGR